MNAPTNARAPGAALLRRLRAYATRNARCSVPWYWRLVSAFGGAALFAATAVGLAREGISRTWSEARHAGDGTALLSQAGVLVGEGRTFALAVIMALVLLVAAVACASFRRGGRLHLFAARCRRSPAHAPCDETTRRFRACSAPQAHVSGDGRSGGR